MKTLTLATILLFAVGCSSTKNTADTMDESKKAEAMNQKMMEAGFLKGTVVAEESESNCPYTIKVEAETTYYLDPVNLDETFQKDGEKIWFTFRGLSMMNRCDKASPINIEAIQKRAE